METLDINDALTGFSADFSDPSVVVETVGNLYPELEFNVSEFDSQTDEICDSVHLTSTLENVAVNDEELVDIETVDDNCTMAERLNAEVNVASIEDSEVAAQTIETEIVFPDMDMGSHELCAGGLTSFSAKEKLLSTTSMKSRNLLCVFYW